MIRINLLPVRVSKKKEAGKNQLIFFALAIVLALICNFLWSSRRAAEVARAEDRLKRTKAEITQLDKIIGEVHNIKEEQAAVKDKLAVLDKLKAGRQGPVRVLDELAQLTPKRLWLKKFVENGGAVTLEGTAGTIDDVSELLTALKRSPYFVGVELQKTTAKTDGRFKLVDFTVTAGLNYQPASPVAAATAAPAR